MTHTSPDSPPGKPSGRPAGTPSGSSTAAPPVAGAPRSAADAATPATAPAKPAQTEPAPAKAPGKAAASKSVPAKDDATKSMPAKDDATKSMPAGAAAAKSGPSTTAPSKAARSKPVPSKTAPATGRRPTGPGPLAAELRIAVMRTSRRLRTEAASRDISPGQYSVLAAILNGSLTVGELAERELIQAPSMTRIVNGLEAAGYVTRGENPQDRRQVLVQVTESGTAVLQRARSRRTQWLAKRVAELTVEERATLRDAARILQEMSAS